MALVSHVFKALEDIVGTENISDEPAVLDSYAFQYMGEFEGKEPRFANRPEAVVLPESTREVQKVVKACNRYNLKFKAFSTGWGSWGGPGSEGVIQIDLRRMNRILEINEKNMYAVVEPYVISARLQAELMKRGLNCNIITAGSNVSALPVAALTGDGFTSVSTSMGPRNVLGVEWVSPTGKVLRLGSVGAEAGWFCGDGPGPSLRSLVRGRYAVPGGLGVVTKAATKVYHWPGPPVPPAGVEGVSPAYTMKPLPTFHTYYIFFPSWERLAQAGVSIAESEIAYMLAGLLEYQLAADIATNNEEIPQLFTKILKSSMGVPGALVGINAISQGEFDYQKKVLNTILAETEGECLPLLDEDNIQGGVTWRSNRVSAGVRQYVRSTGANLFYGVLADWARLPDIREGIGKAINEKYIQKGSLLDDKCDGGLTISIENGHLGMSSTGGLYDPTDNESVRAAIEVTMELSELSIEKYKAILLAAFGDDGHNMLGPLLSNYHLWQRKIKKAFDPNVASDPTHYINIEPSGNT